MALITLIKGRILLFFLISLFFVSLYDYFEYTLRAHNPSGSYSLYRGFSFNSPDNEYYLSYADNYLKGRGWRVSMYSVQNSEEPVGRGSYFRRVPGYPLVYFVFVSIFGQDLGLKFLIVFQHILFFITIYCVYQILTYLHFSNVSRNIVTLLYATVPYFYSNCFYTLTESISPFLFVFYVYFLLKAHHSISKKIFYYCIASFFLGYAILTRPYMGIGGILMLYFLYQDFPFVNSLRYIKQWTAVFLVSGSMVLAWGLRNYITTGEFVLLEKAYHPESLDRMKPEFASLWEFIKCWEPDGSEMNKMQLGMFYAAIKRGDTSSKYREDFIARVPSYVTEVVSKEEIDEALAAYQNLLLSQKVYYDENKPMPSEYTAEQISVASKFEDFTRRYKERYPFRYYLINPLKHMRLIILHSNTSNIYLFQEPFRDLKILNLIRYFLFLFHVSLYLIMFINLWWIKTNLKEVLIVSIIPLLFVLFLAFVFQAVEGRYMLPFLPSLFIGLGFFLDKTNLITRIESLCKSLTLKTNVSPSAT